MIIAENFIAGKDIALAKGLSAGPGEARRRHFARSAAVVDKALIN
jgi:hypothetical protein